MDSDKSFEFYRDVKKFGLDTQTMYDGVGNPLSLIDAVEVMRKRHTHAREAAKSFLRVLNGQG